jgi:hypothetical protein
MDALNRTLTRPMDLIRVEAPCDGWCVNAVAGGFAVREETRRHCWHAYLPGVSNPMGRGGPASSTASGCTARGTGRRGTAATPRSCCSTRTPRRSPARSTGTRPASPTAFDDPTKPNVTTAPPRAQVGRGQPVLRLGQRPRARDARSRTRSSTRSTSRASPSAMPEHPRGAARHLRRPRPPRRHRTCAASASPPSSCMPTHQFVHDHWLVEKGLTQLLGLQLHRLPRPAQRLRGLGPRGRQVQEFKHMVKAMHDAGIEVILDVVYNHTAEGTTWARRCRSRASTTPPTTASRSPTGPATGTTPAPATP